MKSIGSFRAESDVKTWLFSIARNRWHKYLHKKKRTVETSELFGLTELEQPSGSSEETTFLDRELIAKVYEIINEEKERPRKAALMRIEGYSFYEIGNILGISENSARVMFFRTKEKILKILKAAAFRVRKE